MSCIKRCRWFFAQVSNGNVIYCTFWSKCAEWIELTVQCQVLLLAHHRYAKHKYNWLYIFILLLLSIFHSIFIVSLLCVLLCVYILVVLFIVGDEVSVSKMYLIVLTYSSLWTVADDLRRRAWSSGRGGARPRDTVQCAPSIAKLYALRQTQLSEMLKIVKLELIAQTLNTVYLIDVIQAASVFALYIYLSLISFDAIVQQYLIFWS